MSESEQRIESLERQLGEAKQEALRYRLSNERFRDTKPLKITLAGSAVIGAIVLSLFGKVIPALVFVLFIVGALLVVDSAASRD